MSVTLLLLLLIPALFGVRLAWLLRGAFEKTVQDQTWLTPTPPWRDFWFFVARDGRWFLFLLLAFAFALLGLRLALGESDGTAMDYLFFAGIVSIPCSLLLLVFSLLMGMVPRIASRLALALLCVPGGVLLMAITMAILTVALPPTLAWVETNNPRGMSGFSIIPHYVFVVSLLVAAASVLVAQLVRGDRWFRRE